MESQAAEIPHAVLDPRRNHEIIRLFLLEDEPHALHIIPRIPPVAKAGKVPQVQFVLFALGDAGRRQGDLPRNERLPAPFGFMIEQNP